MAWSAEELQKAKQVLSSPVSAQPQSNTWDDFYKSVKPEEEKKPTILDAGKTLLKTAWDVTSYPARTAIKHGKGIYGALTGDYRAGEFKETSEALKSREITPMEAGLRNTGDIIQGVTDYAGEQVFGAVKTVYTKLPEKAQESIKETAQSFVASPVGEYAVEKIQQGGEAWKNFEKSYPRAAENIAALTSIADLALEFTGGTKAAKFAGEVAEELGEVSIKKAATLAARGVEGLGDIGADIKKIGKGVKETIGEGIEGIGTKLPKVGVAKKVDTINDIAEYIKPIRKKSEEIRELARAGTQRSEIQSKTLLKGVGISANANDVRRAKSVERYLTGTGNYVDDISSLNQSISKNSESLKVLLKANDRPFNNNQLKKILNDSVKDITFVGDEAKVYKKVIDDFIKIQKKYKNNTSELWDALKEFDKSVIDRYPNFYNSMSNTPIKSAVKEVRKSVQNQIEKAIPTAGFKKQMTEMSDMFSVRDILAEKAQGEIGESAVGQLMQKAYSIPVLGPLMGKVRILKK
jgi:hypothetical protein